MKKKLLILPILALCLAGCGETNDSSSTSNGDSSTANKADETLDNTKTDTSDGDKKNDNTSSDSSDSTDSDKKDDQKEEEKKEEVVTNDTEWDDTLWDMMRKYLGGNVLPYVELGKYTEGTYTSTATAQAYLTFDGSELYTDTLVSAFKTNYAAAGYVVGTETTTSITATLASAGLKVTLKAVSEYANLVTYYDEPYDETKLTAWPSDITTTFTNSNHGHSIPFVYLGTANPVATVTASTSLITIAGGAWSETIYTNAKTIYAADGWTITEGSDTYSSILTAQKTMDDKCVLTVVIDAYNSTTYKKTNCKITLAEGYNSAAYTSWNSGFDTYKTNNFHNHDVPAIYLATANPTYSWNDSYNRLTVTGKTYSEQVITDAKALLAKSTDWEVVEATINTKPAVAGYQFFDDGCKIEFLVQASSSASTATTYMYIHYDEPYTATSTATDWSNSVKTSIEQNFGSDASIPYFYLGSDAQTATYTASTHTLKITGKAPYNGQMAVDALAAFTKAGWTAQYTLSSNGLGMTATYKDAQGNDYTATLTALAYTSTAPYLNIKMTEPYNSANAETDWPDAVKTNFTKYFNYTLPYVYLGTKTPSSSYSTTTKVLTISGVSWDDEIFTNFETALKKESDDTTSDVTWTFATETHATYGKQVIATGTSGNIVYTATCYKYTNAVPRIEFSKTETFAAPTNGAWPSSFTFTTNDDTYEPPYVYLGTSSPTESYNSTYKTHTITGGTWNNAVISLAKTALEAEGYTVQIGNGYYGGSDLTAYKLYDDGHAYTYYIYKSGTTNTANIMCSIAYSAKGETATSTSWASATQTLISSTLGGYNLPYLATGLKEMTCATYTSTTVKADGCLKFTYYKSSGWTRAYLYEAIKTLKASDANWTFDVRGRTTLTSYTVNNYGKVFGELKRSDGSKIYLYFYGSTTTYAYMYVSYVAPYTAPDEDDDPGYDSAVSTAINNITHDNEIPYIHLGDTMTATSSTSTSGNYVKITGDCWDDSIFTLAEAAFKKDTLTWTTYYKTDFANNDKKLVAVATAADGTSLEVAVGWTFQSTTYEKQAYMTVSCF